MDGFLLTATGEKHVILARKAARSLRQVMPDAKIDLFTDIPFEDDVFDQINILDDPWFRSKIDALILSRFDRTIYIDNDIVVTAPIGFVFDILDTYEFAACRAVFHQSEIYKLQGDSTPEVFSAVNTGFIALRKNKRVIRLLEEWKQMMKTTQAPTDQPILRQLLFKLDIKLYILADELNFILPKASKYPNMLLMRPAPLVLHFIGIGRGNIRGFDIKDPHLPYNLDELIGKRKVNRLRFKQSIVKFPPYKKIEAVHQFLVKSKVSRLDKIRLFFTKPKA